MNRLEQPLSEEEKILYNLFGNMIAFMKQKLTDKDKESIEKLRSITHSFNNEFKQNSPDKQELEKLIDSIRELSKDKDSFPWLWTSYSNVKETFDNEILINKFLLNPEFLRLFVKVAQINDYKLVLGLRDKLKKALLNHPKGIRVVILSYWLFFINPKYFAPVSGELLGTYKDVIKEVLKKILAFGNERWFWRSFQKKLVDRIVDKYLMYNKVLYIIMKENNLKDMIDVIYMIGKCSQNKECLLYISKNIGEHSKSFPKENSSDHRDKENRYCKDLIHVLERVKSILNRKGQVIFYGPPGVGKTFLALNYVKCANDNIMDSAMITFHQSYSYEEFMEGFRPVKSRDEKTISYEVVDGIFKRMAIKATWELFKAICQTHNQENEACRGIIEFINISNKENYSEIKDNVLKILDKLKRNESLREEFRKLYEKNQSVIPKYVLIIDEINRGDISRIFGELISLIEDDKRLLMENQIIIILPYSGEYFAVPPNLYVIGTMNSTDRSIALVDFALRRRFSFIEIEPDPTKLSDREINGLNLGRLLEVLNRRIEGKLDRDHRIGHSYFLKIKDKEDLQNAKKELHHIWFYEIMPQLVEYFYGRLDVLKNILKGAEDYLLECNDNICYPKSPEAIDPDKLVEALKKIVSSE